MYASLRALVLQAFVLSLCVPAGLSAQTNDDASIGKWTLNIAKSTATGPAPKRQMRTYEDRGGGVVVLTLEGIDAQGKPIFNAFTFKYDGKEYPTGFTGYDPTTGGVLSSSYKLVDPFTLEVTQTRRVNGKATSVNTITRTVSKDRKTMTFATAGSNTVTVWDKQ